MLQQTVIGTDLDRRPSGHGCRLGPTATETWVGGSTPFDDDLGNPCCGCLTSSLCSIGRSVRTTQLRATRNSWPGVRHRMSGLRLDATLANAIVGVGDEDENEEDWSGLPFPSDCFHSSVHESSSGVAIDVSCLTCGGSNKEGDMEATANLLQGSRGLGQLRPATHLPCLDSLSFTVAAFLPRASLHVPSPFQQALTSFGLSLGPATLYISNLRETPGRLQAERVNHIFWHVACRNLAPYE